MAFRSFIPQLTDHGRFAMNPKWLLKVFPVVLLTIVPVLGLIAVARSQVVAQQSPNQSQEIDQLIQQLKTGDLQARSFAAYVLGQIGESAIPSLIPLLKDSNAEVRSNAAEALKKLGYKP